MKLPNVFSAIMNYLYMGLLYIILQTIFQNRRSKEKTIFLKLPKTQYYTLSTYVLL